LRTATAWGMVFGVIAVIFGNLGVSDWIAGKNCETYKKTDGKVIRKEYWLDALKGGGGKTGHSTPYLCCKFIYSYTVDGKEYLSDRVSYPSPPSKTQPEVDAYNAKFPDGSPLTVYYDPKNPSQASLLNEVDTRLLVLPICVFIFAGFISLICFLIVANNPVSDPTQSMPPPLKDPLKDPLED
jgi:Protein of unknown function (DUF3592)